ncbi:MAG: hypothetical protein HKN43_03060 [Rhodothermales bacterium]|nr:hypothetical protein [Rhodothermales bacterium]
MLLPHIQTLKGEPPCHADVNMRDGAPRLTVNGEEVAPLAAWSWGLVEATPLYRDAGINILHPILGLNVAWPEPDRYDFSSYDILFDRLLEQSPSAFFLPRILLDMPAWWIEDNTGELVQTALPRTSKNLQYKTSRLSSEGGMLWTNPLAAPSLASSKYREDITRLYVLMLRHFMGSPLVSRIIGYQIGAGIYGEWHYSLAEFMPDTSPHVTNICGPVPPLEDRLTTSHGLFRDPDTEQNVTRFYESFHEDLITPALLDFAAITKDTTNRQILCGAFYGYLLENVWIQEGGHLAPKPVLDSDDIDFLASPYTYQTTNIPDEPWWNHDIVDGGGNMLGRARGLGGDGGYRVLLESLRRHGKLFFVEADSGTHLAPEPGDLTGSESDVDNLLTNIGGDGSETVDGAVKILKRDLGRMWAGGSGGWLFDFGAVMSLQRSWYDAPEIRELLASFAVLMQQRTDLNLSPVADIAAVYDTQSFFFSRHWRNERPLDQPGSVDYFVQWFLDSQARSLHRIGAPVDFLYRSDLTDEDADRYKLLFFFNAFVMEPAEVDELRQALRGSNVTVVWMYAPAYLTKNQISIETMSRLTGFEFDVSLESAPMLIDYIGKSQLRFGTGAVESPRFDTTNHDEVLGTWIDSGKPAFSVRRDEEGWTSIYCGTAPLPATILRDLARLADARLWSSSEDIVVATRDTGMLVATEDGTRTISLAHPMKMIGSNETYSDTYTLNLTMGDVCLFQG